MKIKLAVLESDVSYLNRMVAVFNTKYADKLEIYSYTNQDTLQKQLEESRIDVLLGDEVFDINIKDIPQRCGFAYFVDNPEIESYKNQQAICKFQKADVIYKQILSVYAEKASAITGFKFDETSCRMISFVTAAGGTGCSVVAVAYAKRLAAKQKKVLYLNLEKFGSTSLYFKGEGQADFGDIIYALRSQRSNLSIKLESAVRRDESGVFFYAEPKIALDLKEMRVEDIKRLIMETRSSGSYDYIIMDSNFGLDDMSYTIWKEANAIVLVSDGEETANEKTKRMYQTFKILEQKDESLRSNKAWLLYNKFSSKTGSTITGLEITELGGIPRYEHATAEMIVNQISTMSVLDKLM